MAEIGSPEDFKEQARKNRAEAIKNNKFAIGFAALSGACLVLTGIGAYELLHTGDPTAALATTFTAGNTAITAAAAGESFEEAIEDMGEAARYAQLAN